MSREALEEGKMTFIFGLFRFLGHLDRRAAEDVKRLHGAHHEECSPRHTTTQKSKINFSPVKCHVHGETLGEWIYGLKRQKNVMVSSLIAN